ncbi:MAG: hypothetical protein JST84_26015 [Acidobacteria bacterium]|nr:hypothetical protein [Acidobacteriota bacterium]
MHSSLTHVQYEHLHRANKVELICSQCGEKAFAINPCFQTGNLTCIDLCPNWNAAVWEIRCTQCSYHATEKTFSELGQLYYCLESRGKTLWAWNREHLVMLHKMFTGKINDNDPYANLAVYARREWLLGTRKQAWVKAIEKKLKE